MKEKNFMTDFKIVRSSKNKTFFSQSILSWYAQHKRGLPWRKTTNPYFLLVSEIMLQQTQVPRVIEKYDNFITQFPTVASLADASTSDVLAAWSGLGFNRRALLLQNIAEQVMEKYAGKIPENEQELLQLKGIGPYTAPAILSFAFNRNTAVFDMNILRVLFRFFLGRSPKAQKELEKEIKEIGKNVLPPGKSRDWHNALMDFGSLVCVAGTPKCDICPLRKECKTYQSMQKQNLSEPPQQLERTKQETFIGSNRWYRGQILKMLIREKEADSKELYKQIKKKNEKIILKKERYEEARAALEKEGFVVKEKGKIKVKI